MVMKYEGTCTAPKKHVRITSKESLYPIMAQLPLESETLSPELNTVEALL